MFKTIRLKILKRLIGKLSVITNVNGDDSKDGRTWVTGKKTSFATEQSLKPGDTVFVGPERGTITDDVTITVSGGSVSSFDNFAATGGNYQSSLIGLPIQI